MRKRAKGVFYGWRIVAAGFLGNALTDGTYYLGFAVFFLPISRDLDLSRAAISLPFSLARITAGIMGPIMGQWIDRFGSGKVLAVCALFGGLGFILLRWADSYTIFMMIFLAVLSPGMAGGLSAPGITAVGKWFSKQRAFAMSVTTSGFAIGGAAIPPLLVIGIKVLDWRTVAMICGLAIWAIAPFLAVQLQKSPNSMGPRPDDTQRGSESDVEPYASPEYSVGQALRTRAYWQLALSVGMRTMAFGLFTVHLVAVMTWKGLDEATGGFLVGVYALAWLPALLVMGWMGDRWSKRKVAGAGSFIGSFGILLLLMWDSVEVWQMVLVLVLMAPNISGMSLAWAIIADLFGRRNFGTLRGGVITVMSITGVGAPVYAGWIFDTTGGYTWAIVPTMIATIASGFLLWFLPRPCIQDGASVLGERSTGF